jgi:hypothetical protein
MNEQTTGVETMNKKSAIKRAILGALVTSGFAYALTLGVMVGFNKADAAGSREVPSSDCHAATDDLGSSLQNSGALTFTGAGTRSIYCPMVSQSGQGKSQVSSLNVYGNEGTDGSISRACMCDVNPITCACSNGTNWVNNSGVVANNIDTSVWGIAPAQKFGYLLHSLTTNSTISGMNIIFF